MRMSSMLCGSAMHVRQGAAGIRIARQQRSTDDRAALVNKKAAAHRQPLPPPKPAFEAAHPRRQPAARHAPMPSSPQKGSAVTTFTESEELEQLLSATSIDIPAARSAARKE